MGELIDLTQQLADRARPRAPVRPVFFFNLACPFSYLAAEQVERLLGEVEWVPVAAAHLSRNGSAPPASGTHLSRNESAPPAASAQLSRNESAPPPAAEARASELRLPLILPDGFPAEPRSALRAAVRASQLGFGARFAVAAMRLAFCGGFDLDDPEVLTEAAAASTFPLDECLAAAGDARLDLTLEATAKGLAAWGATRLPVVRVRHGFFSGEQVLSQAAAVSRANVFGAPIQN